MKLTIRDLSHAAEHDRKEMAAVRGGIAIGPPVSGPSWVIAPPIGWVTLPPVGKLPGTDDSPRPVEPGFSPGGPTSAPSPWYAPRWPHASFDPALFQ